MGSNTSHIQGQNNGAADCKVAPKVNDSGVNDGAVLNCEILEFRKSEDMKEFPLNKAVVQEIELRNDNKSESITFRFENRIVEGLSLTFDPLAGKIAPQKEKKIKVKLVVKKRLNVNYSLMFLVNGSSAHFFTVRIRCEDGLFGVDPSGLDFEDDGPYSVPTILVKLKKALIEQEGLVSEGIFRLAGDVKVVNDFKQRMNKGDFTMPSDVNAIATLMKIWFRELPVPLLNGVPKEIILKCDEGDVETSVSYLQENLGKVPFDLFNWLLDLLIETAVNRHLNKMTAQNLAIVVAPNLYEPNATTDPIESLILSQKAVQFVHNVLSYKIKQKEAELGASLDTELHSEELAARVITKKADDDENNNEKKEDDEKEDEAKKEGEAKKEDEEKKEEAKKEEKDNVGKIESEKVNPVEQKNSDNNNNNNNNNNGEGEHEKKKSSSKKGKSGDKKSVDRKRRKSSAGDGAPPSSSSSQKKERKHRKTYAAGGGDGGGSGAGTPAMVVVPPPSVAAAAETGDTNDNLPPPPLPPPKASDEGDGDSLAKKEKSKEKGGKSDDKKHQRKKKKKSSSKKEEHKEHDEHKENKEHKEHQHKEEEEEEEETNENNEPNVPAEEDESQD